MAGVNIPTLVAPTAEEQRLIKLISERNEFQQLEDGYIYWWPTIDTVFHEDGAATGGGGALSSWQLRAIADELDRRNATWDRMVKADPQIAIGEIPPPYTMEPKP